MQAFEKLLELVPETKDRVELRRLAVEFVVEGAAEEVLDRIKERIAWALRATRYPLPSREELQRMLRGK